MSSHLRSGSGISNGPHSTTVLASAKLESGVATRHIPRSGYAYPIYGEAPELFEEHASRSYTKEEFAEKYILDCGGMNPKQIRVPRDCTNDEVVALFGPTVGKNGHHYTECKDEKLIARIENLWMILHQRRLVPASRVISQAMARGFVCEVKRNKRMNWAAYGEWTNAEQLRRRVKALKGGGGTVLGDDEVPDCTTASGLLSGGEEAFHLVDSSCNMEELVEYKNLVDAALKEAQVRLEERIKSRDASAMKDVIARGQMRDRTNLLLGSEGQLQILLDQLAEKEATPTTDGNGGSLGLEQLQIEISAQRLVVKTFQKLADEGEMLAKNATQSDDNVTGEIIELENDVEVCKRHAEAVANILMCEGRPGLGLGANIVSPKPYFCNGETTTVERNFLPTEKCVFCGLGFAPLWALRFSSCQHPYHHWCATYHFARTEKCVSKACNEQVQHVGWWESSGLRRPNGVGLLDSRNLVRQRRIQDDFLGSPQITQTGTNTVSVSANFNGGSQSNATPSKKSEKCSLQWDNEKNTGALNLDIGQVPEEDYLPSRVGPNQVYIDQPSSNFEVAEDTAAPGGRQVQSPRGASQKGSESPGKEPRAEMNGERSTGEKQKKSSVEKQKKERNEKMFLAMPEEVSAESESGFESDNEEERPEDEAEGLKKTNNKRKHNTQKKKTKTPVSERKSTTSNTRSASKSAPELGKSPEIVKKSKNDKKQGSKKQRGSS